MRKLLFIGLLFLFNTACDVEDLPPELQDLVSRNDQPWRVQSLTVSGDALNESVFEAVRYTFTVNEAGNTYTAVIPANSLLTTQGFKPNYNAVIDQGTWEVGAGKTIVFDGGDPSITSKVKIIGEPQADRIELEWLVPESFDKIAPLCNMVLVPE